jgi:hypothetical protein
LREFESISKLIIIMGAATVAENSIKATTDSFWKQLPTLPSSRLLDFNLDNLNKSFVNFAVVVGVLALAKSTISLARNALKSRPKVPTKAKLLEKYGQMAWALIADCKDNEDYVAFLAKNGFNLVLLGSAADIQRSRELALQIDNSLQVTSLEVNWATSETDIEFYKGL